MRDGEVLLRCALCLQSSFPLIYGHRDISSTSFHGYLAVLGASSVPIPAVEDFDEASRIFEDAEPEPGWSPNPVGFSRVSPGGSVKRRKCLRCGTLYLDEDNSPAACSFHGHTTGEKGLFSFAPPHQGIDGEWSDRSGVIVYKWNEKNNRPNTGSINWKKRWSCCAEYDDDAPPCQRGWHVSYDDGFTLY